MRTGLSRRVLLPVLFLVAFAAVLYVSRPHLTQLPQVVQHAKSQTPNGMDANMEKEALDQVAESADMTFPLFDYTYDKIATLSTERRRSKDPCGDVLLPNGGTEARHGEGQRVLVTGGAGFIGSNLVDRLLQLGYKIRIFDNLYTGFLRNVPLDHSDVEFVLGDILNHTALDHAMEGVDYVFHLAAMSKVVPSLKDPDMARFCTEANALGSWNVLDSVRNQGNVKKVIYAASSTYYGNRQPPHSEDMAADFLTPYAASKFEGEIQMQMFDRLFGVPTLSTRFFMVYGPRQPSTGAYAIVTGVFAKQAADSRPLTIEGDGTHYRDFIHVRDIVEGMIISQQIVDLRGEVVNLGSGTAFSVNDVANLISSNQVHVDPRPNDLEGTLADTCKMKRLLNYRAQADFKTEMGYMAKETMAGNVFMQPWLQPMHALAAPHLLAPGTPVFKWPSDTKDIDALLLALKHVELSTLPAESAESSRVSVIVFSATEEDSEERMDILLNTVFSLVRFGEVRKYLIAAVDEFALASCVAVNLPCYDARTMTLPILMKDLTSRGKDIHFARFGNSYIGPVQAWFDALVKRHPTSDVLGAAPQGDVFVISNDKTRAAIRSWAQTWALELHEPESVETLHNVDSWPTMDFAVATYKVDRLCKSGSASSSAKLSELDLSHASSSTSSAPSGHEDGSSSEIPASLSGGERETSSKSSTYSTDTEPQSLAELEDTEQIPLDDIMADYRARRAKRALSDDESDDSSDSFNIDSESSSKQSSHGSSKHSSASASSAGTGHSSLAGTCTRAFYRAVGCSSAEPLASGPQIMAQLRAADAWHLTACKDRKHCDRQQVVPSLWVKSHPDLATIGGLCA